MVKDYTQLNVCTKKVQTGSNNAGTDEVSYTQKEKKGLNVFSAAVFIAGEMAGSGVLALPKAIVDSGWIGLIILVVFCFNAGYGGTRLGACWDIIEERYPEHRGRTRNPYTTIAHRAVGKWGSVLVSGCIQFTLFGAGTVYLLLSSQIFQELLIDHFPRTSFCVWFLLIAAVLTPAMWLGSPKEFRIVGVGALLTTAVACVLFFTQIVMDGMNKTVPTRHEVHGFQDFFLSFGTLLFAFGGASTFPTIQNDMENKQKFSTSVTAAFIVILILYLPVTAGGYFIYGEDVTANISMSLSKTSLVTIANILMGVHLVLAFLIVINPVCQELEEIFKVPRHYHWKRSILRTCIIFTMVVIGETIPRFGKILSLVGGSTITLLTFVFPPYFYMKLCGQKNPLWPERHIPGYIRIYLWELIVIGLVGGTASTYSAIKSIFGSGMTVPCYWPSS
ncbi:PREDICTED: amino acid transporter ANTL1-like isoform X2 [Nicrophorus vespilloides]|uniref:Amino acid transporter ANTL1-like isoform X2 n=1 Tax=Nicrophorus vespilloides TaxID=110193 RepID=A0ABM1MZY2_NICVS|nr:PREDICTED: amino acid transporter ANTL1-like isoform X2 [Nicrophorus vespilloides]